MVYHIMDNPRFMHTEGEEGDGDTAEEGGEQRGGVAWKKGVIQFSLDHACALEVYAFLPQPKSRMHRARCPPSPLKTTSLKPSKSPSGLCTRRNICSRGKQRQRRQRTELQLTTAPSTLLATEHPPPGR